MLSEAEAGLVEREHQRFRGRKSSDSGEEVFRRLRDICLVPKS